MIRTVILLGLGVALVGAAPTEKHEHPDQVAARAALARGDIKPIARILAIATARVPGDVVKVELKRKAFGFQYKVKILAATGRLREVELNARTGAVLSIEED